jgi:hypothetical protein
LHNDLSIDFPPPSPTMRLCGRITSPISSSSTFEA